MQVGREPRDLAVRWNLQQQIRDRADCAENQRKQPTRTTTARERPLGEMEAELILVALWCAVQGDGCRSSRPKQGDQNEGESTHRSWGSERTGRKSGVRRKPIISSTSDATAVRRDGSDATFPRHHAWRSRIPFTQEIPVRLDRQDKDCEF
jgi:hypothetical protein